MYDFQTVWPKYVKFVTELWDQALSKAFSKWLDQHNLEENRRINQQSYTSYGLIWFKVGYQQINSSFDKTEMEEV